MSTKNILRVVLAGVLFAAIVCIAVGMCFYFPAISSLNTPDLGQEALEESASAMRLGMFIMIVGITCLVLSILAFIGSVLIEKLAKNKN